MTTTTTPQTFLVYTAKVCPYAQRALLALDEAGVPYQPYEIDLLNKPEWYESKVNAASKVPVLVLDPGSDKQVNLPESLVIAEYVAEQYEEKMGEQALLPKE